MKNILNILPGFRSQTPWKMVIGGLVYLFLFFAMLQGLGDFIFCSSLIGAIILVGIANQKLKDKKPISRYSSYIAIILVTLMAGSSLATSVDPNFGKSDSVKSQNASTTTDKTQDRKTPENQKQQPQEQTQETSTNQQEQISNNQENVSSPLKLIVGTVIRVIDGDTAVIALSNGKEEKVRFIGVDTPESTTQHEPYGEEASVFTKRELDGKRVYLEIDVGERDKYGRLLAYIWLTAPTKIDNAEINSKMFNARLLIDGYAQVMTIPPNVKYSQQFLELQRLAREADKGLWALGTSQSQPQSQSKPESQQPSKTTKQFVGSKESDKYHYPDCRWAKKILPVNEIWFNNVDDAHAHGYIACKVCDPPS